MLTGENERLKEEVSRLQVEKEELKKEANAAREHYEAYGTQLNQNILQISARVILAFVSIKVLFIVCCVSGCSESFSEESGLR